MFTAFSHTIKEKKFSEAQENWGATVKIRINASQSLRAFTLKLHNLSKLHHSVPIIIIIIYLPIYLPIYLSTYLSTYLPIYLSIYLFACILAREYAVQFPISSLASVVNKLQLVLVTLQVLLCPLLFVFDLK